MPTHSHDSRVGRPHYRLQIILIAALIAVGAAAAMVWRSLSSGPPAPKTSTISIRASSSERANPGSVGAQEQNSNPAAQKAGPPDPVAQNKAAASAESAAKAAAELAAAQ